ncbi:MAG: class I SAM-dependent methyltransferase [Desulfobacterales bacterium]|jgi:predicted O-methyltransferase YrrM
MNEVCMVLPDPALLQDVKGFLDDEEGRRIYTLALEVSGRGPCLEIGSYCGKSTLYLGAACRESGSILFSVDHHRGSEEQQPGEEYFDPELWDPRSRSVDTLPAFRHTIARAGLEAFVVPMVCPSEVAARAWATPLSLIFIDGGHAEETVRADYLVWSNHLIPGGYLLFHDVFTDPAEGGQAPFAAYRQARDDDRFDERPMTDTLGVLRRKGRGKK